MIPMFDKDAGRKDFSPINTTLIKVRRIEKRWKKKRVLVSQCHYFHLDTSDKVATPPLLLLYVHRESLIGD